MAKCAPTGSIFKDIQNGAKDLKQFLIKDRRLPINSSLDSDYFVRCEMADS